MNARDLVRTGLEWCGVLLLVVVALPIVALVFFILRFAVLGVVALGLAVLAAGSCVYPPLRRWARGVLGPPEDGTRARAEPR